MSPPPPLVVYAVPRGGGQQLPSPRLVRGGSNSQPVAAPQTLMLQPVSNRVDVLFYRQGVQVPASMINMSFRPLPPGRQPVYYGHWHPVDLDEWLTNASDVTFGVFKAENPGMYDPNYPLRHLTPNDAALSFAGEIARQDAMAESLMAGWSFAKTN